MLMSRINAVPCPPRTTRRSVSWAAAGPFRKRVPAAGAAQWERTMSVEYTPAYLVGRGAVFVKTATAARRCPSPHIAPTAVLCGDVTIGPHTRVLFGAVITAEGGPVEIGANCVVMEHAVVRGVRRHPVRLGGPRARRPTRPPDRLHARWRQPDRGGGSDTSTAARPRKAEAEASTSRPCSASGPRRASTSNGRRLSRSAVLPGTP